MKTAIIIPAFNEEERIGHCLESFINQSRKPDKLLVVDDRSTDSTPQIVSDIAARHDWMELVLHESTAGHQPGAKVVRAFQFGLSMLEEKYQLVGKFDADVVLPSNYLESVVKEFDLNTSLGLCSGLLYVKKGNQWVYESIADKSHVRGPVKLYRSACLKAMKGLRPGLGWDTADVILAQYYGFEVKTLEQLQVKHLRPTGGSYDKSVSLKQGQAYYLLRYGMVISLLSALKMAYYKKSTSVIWQSIKGYFQAKSSHLKPLVDKEEGRFIRRYRWKRIRKALI